MRARIYQPTKSAMQSGRALIKRWLLEYEPETPQKIDPLMGWTSSNDMRQQVQLEFDSQKNGLAVGTWTAGEFKQRFVCALVNSTVWNCVDAGGRASIEVKSATEIKVCYLDNREGAQGAGCGLLKKAQ